eukprot:4444315-Prorocentrum_lima.AAC.1
MTSSLVGSEMCIRDSPKMLLATESGRGGSGKNGAPLISLTSTIGTTVSYTHLTLPTICSV